MSKIHKSIAELVGNTPLVELTNYESKYGLKAHIIGKLEFLNPTGSVKDRLALALIRDGEKKGAIKKGDTLIDVTSGNTGIALAGIGHALGYEYVPYLEPGTTIERVQIFEGYGLDLQSFYDIKEVADFEKKGLVLDDSEPLYGRCRVILERYGWSCGLLCCYGRYCGYYRRYGPLPPRKESQRENHWRAGRSDFSTGQS